MRSMLKGRIDDGLINQRTTQPASRQHFQYNEYDSNRRENQLLIHCTSGGLRYIMDPDGDYESLHSARSLGTTFKNAKLDDADESNKNCSNDGLDEWKGKDEEMGLKPSPTPNASKVVLAEEKEGCVDLKPSAPLADDLGCLPSAPPLESSLHPSPEDDGTAPPTPESSHPPEPPSFKEDVNEAGNYIPDSVALPIGLNNADRALPVASVVPIITDAMGAAETFPPIIPSNLNSANQNSSTCESFQQHTAGHDTIISGSSANRAPARRVPSFLRQSSTHPAPAAATLADPQPPQQERDKSDSPGCKTCKKLLATILVVAIAGGVAIGLITNSKPIQHNYPNCHVSYPEWIGDGTCDDGKYNTEECGWDGGDCGIDDYPDCHVLNSNKISDGNCDGGSYNTEECGWDGGDCQESSDITTPIKDTEPPAHAYSGCHVDNPDWIGDGFCNGGGYNTAQCAWDGGDCVVGGYPDCHVVRPLKIGDGNCDGSEYNSEECGWDGGDCLSNCHVDNPDWIGDGFCNGGGYNTAQCAWDGGDCVVEGYPDCHVVRPLKIGDGNCDGSEYNSEECGWDGGDCLIADWPNCHIDNPDGLGNGLCNKGSKVNSIECGFDGGDCTDMDIADIKALHLRYPNCHVSSEDVEFMDSGACMNRLNTIDCGYDGGDCLFERHSDKKCNGSVRSTWSNKSRAWCQKKCLDEGNSCKAYDIGVYWESETGRCRIFSSYSSESSKSDSRCYKKK